ncbi:head GIN domain-containing protein [Sphingomonas flavalba]|uniref:head GIN domain-containing protein n=1 Tax=Sphingomonas flavalba TaxID=2559804 RepID=UPI00109DA6D3|nr:head GIN domain-containing protein [Sphingomonas flavalba]
MRIFAAALLATALAACTPGNANSSRASGQTASRSFPASGFDRIQLAGSDRVIVKVGGRESVTATGDTAVLDRLEIEVRNGRLRIGRKRNSGWVLFSDGSRGHATVTVTLPKLAEATIAGSGDMDVDRASGERFDAGIAGSGNLRVAALDARSASFDIAGSGDLVAAGTAGAIAVSIAGSGNVDAAALKSDQAKISVAGSGGVKAGVDGEAVVSIMGSGDVAITGKASCRVSRMGSGSVHCPGQG